MRTRNRADDDDDHVEPQSGHSRVLEKLQADLPRRELLRSDTRANYHGREQCGADELGEEPSAKRRTVDHAIRLSIDNHHFNRYM